MSEDALRRKLARSQAKVDALEHLLEDKTRELFISNRDLSSSNQFMSSILRSMAGGLIVVDDQWRITMVNQRLIGITGHPESDLVGRPIHDVLPGAGSYRPDEVGTAKEEDTILSTATGEIPIALTHGSLPDGIGHVYVVIDTRERKQSEAALRKAQQELVQASRKAGMAEVATGVIHNVGNVITAVNVAIRQLLDQEEESRLPGLRKVVGMLHGQPDLPGFFASPRGPKVVPFLDTLDQRLVAEQDGRRQGLRRAMEHLEHVATVIAAQQQHASKCLVLEELSAAVLLDQVLDLYATRVQELGVEVGCMVDPDLRLHSDRHQLVQILVNLVSNALDALEQVPGPRRLVVNGLADEGRARFLVRDSGVGIEAANLDRIFSHGFTTRPEGHGFGLHSAANAATQLGGTLTCTSEGSGHGAEFVLDVPLRAREEAA